jgi:prepilin-type N-terminal cleavage/methylation domain-containing protein
MKLLSAIRGERGFTLQETLVVMIVGSMLVGFSYALLQFVMHFLYTNLEIREHRETAQHIAAMICADIERSRYAHVTDSTIALERPMGKEVIYSSHTGTIARNEVALAPMGVSLWRITCGEVRGSSDTSLPLVAANISSRWKRGNDSVLIRAALPWSSEGAFARATWRKQ